LEKNKKWSYELQQSEGNTKGHGEKRGERGLLGGKGGKAMAQKTCPVSCILKTPYQGKEPKLAEKTESSGE